VGSRRPIGLSWRSPSQPQSALSRAEYEGGEELWAAL